jgi:preprotein translocase subunit YajC
MIYADIRNCNTQYAIRIYTQFTQYRNSIRTNTRIYANGIYSQIRRIYANDLRIQYAWYAINTQMIYADIRNCNTQYAIRIYTQFTQYRNSIRTNTRIYANGIYAQIRRIYANDLRIQYAWYAINTQSIRNQYAVIRNTQYANQYATIRMYTQFIYAIHNTQLPKMSIRMIRKYLFPYASIRIHTQWAVCWC